VAKKYGYSTYILKRTKSMISSHQKYGYPDRVFESITVRPAVCLRCVCGVSAVCLRCVCGVSAVCLRCVCGVFDSRPMIKMKIRQKEFLGTG
jgi:hypothetical protein